MAAARPSTSSQEVIAYEEKAQLVRIVYDTWTPRPHFIVVQCEPTSNATPEELQTTYKMIGSFLRESSKFDNQTILSFHCGEWYQQHTAKWHAHLCVPEQPYLEEARKKITQIPNNKEWKGAQTVDEGIRNWEARKVADYQKYRDECVRKNIPDQTSVGSVALSTFDSASTEFKLVWTSPAPRIAVVDQSPANSSMVSLYTFMTNFRVAAERALAQCDRNFANFGCHLCLYVRGQDGIAVTCRQDRVLMENGSINENPNIVGYIQMDESQYVQWLPNNLRRVWLSEFRQAQHFVRT